MLNGSLRLVTNARLVKRPKSTSHLLSPRQPLSFSKSTSTPCSCHLPPAIATWFKPVACFPPGPNGMHFARRPDARSEPFYSKKSYADGEPSRKLLLTMEQLTSLPSNGSKSTTTSAIFTSPPTTLAPTVSSNDNTAPFVHQSSKLAKATSRSGRRLPPMPFGLITLLHASRWGILLSSWR